MIPKETKCKYCGKPILWIRTERGPKPIEAGWTPFKRRNVGGPAPALFTNEGLRIPCTILTEDQADLADGFAHRAHICTGRPVKMREPTWREKSREEYREFRDKMAAGED